MSKRSPPAELTYFGESLRSAIEESPKYENRADFCRKLGITEKTLRRYEIGETSPPLDFIEMCARALECPIWRLVDSGDRNEILSQDPAEYPSLAEFLAGPEGSQCSAEEIVEMRSMYHSRRDPGIMSWHFMLMSIRARTSGRNIEPPPASPPATGFMARRKKS